MIKNDSSKHLPTLDQVIDRFPLTVAPDTPLAEVITLMGQRRPSCSLNADIPPTEIYPQLTETPNPVTSSALRDARGICVFVVEQSLEKSDSQSAQNSQLQGIFTERDLVDLIASGKNLKNVTIAEVMQQPAATLTKGEDRDIFSALILLGQQRIHHLPILDSDGQLLGVITPESIRQGMVQPANILKMRQVKEVMTAQVIQAPVTSSVMSLAELMAQHRVSCVVITPPTELWMNLSFPIPLGIVTERDIVDFQALDIDLSQTIAETVMSSPLFSLKPEDSLWVAHQEMQQRLVRRLVVTGEQGELLGIVTQSTLLRVLDPMEMSGAIDILHASVQEQTSELQKAIASLSLTNSRLEQEIVTRKQAEVRLQLLESAVVNANDAIVIMDAGYNDISDPTIIYVNEAFTQMTGYRPEEIIGQTPSCLRGPDSDGAQVAKIRRAFSRREPLRLELINYRKDGSTYWVELNSVPVADESGNLTHWVSVQRDISDRKRMEQAFFKEKELAQVTLQSIGDAVIATDSEGCISTLNPVAEKLTGWSTSEAKGLPLASVLRIVDENTRMPIENIAQIALYEGRIVDQGHNSLLIARHNREFAIDHCVAPIHASNGTIVGAVVVFRDVTQVRTQARQLTWQATHDPLTQLVNRHEFEYQLEHALHSSKGYGQEHVMLYLDLDRFKIVNDTNGHVAGDELLRQVSQLLKSNIRKTDILARLGGDEFAVLLYNCPAEQGLDVAKLLLSSIQEFRFPWQDKTFAIGVSIGLVAINPKTVSTSAVLSAADLACYAAKNKGRNRVQVYQAGDRELIKQHGETQWAVEINQALEENRFRLYSQPIVPFLNSPTTGTHCEILLRLQLETGQLVSPMAFIPAAERYNLMHAIDRWVIRTLFGNLSQIFTANLLVQNPGADSDKIVTLPACCSLSNSQSSFAKYPSLYAINLSGDSLNEEKFIDFIQEQFSIYQIPPEIICFEITETVAIANLSKAACLIWKLKELGCQFALDDFGSGMSSFAYLKNLPVDYIKIDGNFIKNLAENPIDIVMVEAIAKIARAMGIKTIAEYVESQAVMDKLKELGVDYGQGYYLGKPQNCTVGSPIVEEVLGEFSVDSLDFETKLAS
ncbi:MAG: EAL domain-containing protein [Microcoleus sp. PH2017_10_PVI_O_A]|uniref:EAL domain-containing protein n=1 Tax=unclassified Microcoleus TaxID=2642155 RepID=UPI001D888FDB|nr:MULTISPECIES: EAL domain-containing protein [unclassified Microcoleus]TAE84117.1 MAG: EAL domain-containing protein [Oscillatoriales cyanobacterium]MCC3405627.1 EAL domain-containing protein [Microcoleus sp. PH2017_10_PVI_O_A]MCC3459606.1 EAL domain-containing protein [Microcoleus sp. PH2017_11_PCY_U_A]MCC3478092.1 EAL domain-containing protein [Microcoleus sp. PH2017_12_PCY_D_A]MCC3528082.1 EAL domain-containing protein [Microcoleus sp. PH2017_21_RUC_O_A]